MSQHVPEELLNAFVLGDVDEALAVHIAEHLDACPACATRAAGLEPLAHVFAAVDDPVPPDLVAAVLAEAGRPERRLAPEVPLGAALLAASVLLAALFGRPLAALETADLLMGLATSVARALGAGLGASPVLMAATVATVVLGCTTVALAGPRPLLLSDHERTGVLR